MIRVWFRDGKIDSIQTVRTLKLLLQIIHRVIPVTTGFEKANSWLGLRNNLPCHLRRTRSSIPNLNARHSRKTFISNAMRVS